MITLEYLILLYVTIVFGVYIYMAHRAYRKHKPIEEINTDTPSVTILVPAYNEEDVIVTTINSLLLQDYPNFNITVINDGSSDTTLELLNSNFSDNKKCTIINQENSGKSVALNAGIKSASSEWVLFIDADTILKPNAISRMVSTLEKDTDATACIVSVSNGCIIENDQVIVPLIPNKIIPRIQWMEYLRTFILWRASTLDKNSALCISGAFGMVKLETLREIGGFKSNFLGEDMELTLNLHAHDKKIQFVPEVLAWTEAPETISDLGKQRVRWFRGGLQSLIKYRNLIGLKNKNKYLGRFLLPFIWIADICGPWVELLGFIMTVFAVGNGTMELTQFIMIWAYAACLHIISSLLVLRYARKKLDVIVEEKNFLKAYPIFILEPFTYHMLHVTWMLKGHLQEYLGIKAKWNKVDRNGINKINK